MSERFSTKYFSWHHEYCWGTYFYVICHDLLRCTNQNYKVAVQNISGAEELRERLWNRDLAACLNMIHIARNLRLHGEIPERFQCASPRRHT
ncbi:hypothetical protein G6F46_005470 [Rhizopus delemar]|uniref:Uncharacterized protein n=2 Tax=Rhizopus TaxID=4842 RepID=A0A9P6Z5M6_9FUNG|nr:hypothetical protein G6F43_006208 [Rhizopus delemar]KAG1545205.1 hypothetical protein G6F51_005606 [Rhizopus arrhizus]KAG1460628.1 hypothetical protein G6F55_004047 [Rhizopus delemar]KAG1498993.1 hypothetical protein G6F54_004696 [Rhizopus delemar]KAG1512736.1 hypothetical protein G6F53_004957 [Rhizopus delemar]